MATNWTSPSLQTALFAGLDNTNSWRQAFDDACQRASLLGFPYLIYAPVRAHADANQNWSATTYPAAWQDIYTSKKYLSRNPVRRQTLQSHRPFTWLDLEGTLQRADAEVFSDCRDAGMANGFVVPVHGPNGQAIAVGFACEHADAVDTPALAQLNLLAHQLYQSQDIKDMMPVVRLTPRERELVQLLLDGLDNLEIADLLNLSDNSVEWHLKNVFRKLQVKNRTAAAVKAVRLGLVYV